MTNYGHLWYVTLTLIIIYRQTNMIIYSQTNIYDNSWSNVKTLWTKLETFKIVCTSWLDCKHLFLAMTRVALVNDGKYKCSQTNIDINISAVHGHVVYIPGNQHLNFTSRDNHFLWDKVIVLLYFYNMPCMSMCI